MEILGIGASEFVFIILIAIIILGPKDMQKAGRTIGRWLNQLLRSDGWKIFQKTSTELRNLPRNLMREANMELQDVDKEIRRSIDPRQPASTSRSASSPGLPLSNEADNAGQTQSVPPAVPGGDDANSQDSAAEHIETK